jgi:hypothetical protein
MARIPIDGIDVIIVHHRAAAHDPRIKLSRFSGCGAARTEMDAGEKVFGKLVVSCCDGAKVLEFVEEALDEVALAIESEVARQRDRAAWMGRNDRSDLREGQARRLGVAVGVIERNQHRG